MNRFRSDVLDYLSNFVNENSLAFQPERVVDTEDTDVEQRERCFRD